MDKTKALELRKKIIEKDFGKLNSMQLKAVTTVEGPLLILAGAGSGKTTVLINRITNMLKYGNAFNSDKIYCGFREDADELFSRYLDGERELYPEIEKMLCVDAPQPWQILAITFTNKAANELKDRLCAALGEDAGKEVWAGTFHSCCVRILRRYADRLGYSSHFTIYDTDDSKRVLKECERQLSLDDKQLPLKSVLTEISNAKDALLSPEQYIDSRPADARTADIARVYKKYQEQLKSADAMDFDDIIVNTVDLLSKDAEVLEYYRNRFRYIMVDEYQDTNHAQYVLVSLLAGGHNNICVVGDDDQSIYSFRGATIENILSFEKQFANATVIRLEENYRSTGTILDAANAVIANNTQRKGKNLWTGSGKGEKITLKCCDDASSEAYFIADTIMKNSLDGMSYADNAVLYRTNAQSNSIENALAGSGIPYTIVGGHRFYDRKEIKDALAYLAVVSNHGDDVRLRRIINEPKRGIGDTTLNNVAAIAGQLGISMFEVMAHSDEYAQLARSRDRLILFTKMIESFSAAGENCGIAELMAKVLMETGYIASLQSDPSTARDRAQNLDELYNTIVKYEEDNAEEASLEGFLEEVALISDLDSLDSSADRVTLMTLHSAKGLEFPCVFLAGTEEGIFPSPQSEGDEFRLEEERRLAYVGITRAKKKLYILRAYSRMTYGRTSINPPSRFISEIPAELIDDLTPEKSAAGHGASGFDGYGYGGSYVYGGGRYAPGSYGAGKPKSGKMHSVEQARPKPGVNYGFSGDSDTAARSGGASITLRPGDRVIHKKFGAGMVLSAKPMGGDSLLEIAFDESGTKKLMQNHAGLVKE